MEGYSSGYHQHEIIRTFQLTKSVRNERFWSCLSNCSFSAHIYIPYIVYNWICCKMWVVQTRHWKNGIVFGWTTRSLQDLNLRHHWWVDALHLPPIFALSAQFWQVLTQLKCSWRLRKTSPWRSSLFKSTALTTRPQCLWPLEKCPLPRVFQDTLPKWSVLSHAVYCKHFHTVCRTRDRTGDLQIFSLTLS